MRTRKTLLTAEDIFKLWATDRRYELVKGEMYEMPPAGARHGDVASETGARLRVHVRTNQLGRVFAAETGFILRRDPDTVEPPTLPSWPPKGFHPSCRRFLLLAPGPGGGGGVTWRHGPGSAGEGRGLARGRYAPGLGCLSRHPSGCRLQLPRNGTGAVSGGHSGGRRGGARIRLPGRRSIHLRAAANLRSR